MRKPEKRSLEYCGYTSPRDFDEIKFELLGLENLIKKAEERISMLNQSSYLASLALNEEKKDLENYFYNSENKNDSNSIFEKK
tara:strand:- start:385 stop:633 length:249 start_codon:yes stop_codon:yes gene_type:complete